MKPFLLLLFFFSSPLHSQFLSTRISAADWALKSFADIRYGQVAVLHEPGGDRLTVYTLRDGLPKPLPISTASSAPTHSGNCLLVSDFDAGMRNALGGSFNVFQRVPSSAFAEYATGSDGRRALRLSYTKERDGFSGLWIHLFNSTAEPEERRFLDATGFSAFTFWIRGSTAKEQLTLKVADAAWERKEDALEIGNLDAFLSSGKIDTAWQRAVIPFSRIPPRLNKSQLATLSFEGSEMQRGSVDIKSLAFCRDTSSLLPLPLPFSRTIQFRKFERALWVWNTDELSNNAGKRKSLFGLLSNEKVSHVFLAIPYRSQNAQHRRGIDLDPNVLRPLVSQLKKRNITVHALLGDKDFILPEQRPFVRSTLENILTYNASSKKQERFEGIHFDVEPYLLPGFNGPRSSWILASFVNLLGDAASIAKRGKLLIGADIPFWFDTPDEFSCERRLVNFRGVTKPVHEHVIDLMDIVVLMSYRTFAAGADGIVLHSSDELTYASKTGKRVFVGLETSPLPDENILTFRGTSSAPASRGKSAQFVAIVPGRDSADVYVLQPSHRTAFGSFLTQSGVDTSQVHWWPVSQDLFVPGTKVSFATLSASKLQDTMGQILLELSAYSSFEGVAIHHSESYLQLLSRP